MDTRCTVPEESVPNDAAIGRYDDGTDPANIEENTVKGRRNTLTFNSVLDYAAIGRFNDGTDPANVEGNTLTRRRSTLTFQVDEKPPLYIGLFHAFQMVVSNLPGNVAAVFLIHSTICGGRDYEFLAKMLATSIAMTGVATFLQVMIGIRLPIAQGSAFSFFPPIIGLMTTKEWECPSNLDIALNETDVNIEKPWQSRLLYISGGMIFASLVQVFLGVTGLVGFLTTFIGPVTIAPCVMLIGLSLWGFVADASEHQWGIAILTALLMMFFSLVLGKINIPTPAWSKSKGFHFKSYPLIRMFSSILAIMVCWLLCYILTVTGQFTDDPDQIGYKARTDAKLDAINKMDWFYFPYPGQFGIPSIGGVGIFIGMLAATLSSIIESIGDYYAIAKICELPQPPKHAINRGIAIQGIAAVLGGFVGTCHGTTSLSQMIGFISYTGVASHITWIFMSIMLVLLGIFGKLTGAIATLPDPVVGGVAMLSLGLVICVGISQLHGVDLEEPRNQMALGMALLLGIMIPSYLQSNPGVINTGYGELDIALVVFLTMGPMVGGVVACLFDNILPGSKKIRGMDKTIGADIFLPINHKGANWIYNLPFLSFLKRFSIFSWIPCLPCYIERCEAMCSCCRGKVREEQGPYDNEDNLEKPAIKSNGFDGINITRL